MPPCHFATPACARGQRSPALRTEARQGGSGRARGEAPQEVGPGAPQAPVLPVLSQPLPAAVASTRKAAPRFNRYGRPGEAAGGFPRPSGLAPRGPHPLKHLWSLPSRSRLTRWSGVAVSGHSRDRAKRAGGGARCGRGPRARPGRAPHCRPYVTSVGRPGMGAAPSPSESADALGAPAELSLPTPHRQAGGAGSHRATEGEGATHGAPQPEEPLEPASGPTQPLGGTLLELALCGVLGLGLQDWGLPAAFLGEPSRNFHFLGPHPQGLPWLGQSGGGCGTVPLWESLPASASAGLSRAIRKCTGLLPGASLPRPAHLLPGELASSCAVPPPGP